MKRRRCVAALTMTLFGVACGGNAPTEEASRESTPAAADDSAPMTFTEADLDKFERGLRKEIDAVRAAQQKAASASTAQERGEAMQAQWETATIPLGAEASGLAEPRYREVREGVNRVFTMVPSGLKAPTTRASGSRKLIVETPARRFGS